jgi:iron complex transport system substrate-binding protein
MIRILGLLFILVPFMAAADSPTRIVSVGGALTETVYALGAGDLVVGSDTTSYFPKAAGETPKVGYMRALSAEGILSLNPDLVILSNESGPPAVIEQLKSAGTNMLSLKAGRTVEDVKQNIQLIGQAISKEPEATNLIAEIDGQAEKLKTAVANLEGRKRVLFILQHSGGAPLVAGQNTAAASIIELSGAVNAVTGYDGYKPLSPESATALAPEVILVTLQGLQQIGGMESVKNIPGIHLTPAAMQGNIIDMDALLLLGFGPRTPAAALELNRRVKDL